MANLSLEIGILVQISVLRWSISVNPTWSYTRLLLCVCACVKCTLKLCMVMHNYTLSSWAWNKRFDLKILHCKKIFVRYPKRQKYFTINSFHTKISNSECFPNYSMYVCMYVLCIHMYMHTYLCMPIKNLCNWIWEKLAFMHTYYLEILILII